MKMLMELLLHGIIVNRNFIVLRINEIFYRTIKNKETSTTIEAGSVILYVNRKYIFNFYRLRIEYRRS